MRDLKIDKNNIQKITKLILVFLFGVFILFPNISKAGLLDYLTTSYGNYAVEGYNSAWVSTNNPTGHASFVYDSNSTTAKILYIDSVDVSANNWTVAALNDPTQSQKISKIISTSDQQDTNLMNLNGNSTQYQSELSSILNSNISDPEKILAQQGLLSIYQGKNYKNLPPAEEAALLKAGFIPSSDGQLHSPNVSNQITSDAQAAASLKEPTKPGTCTIDTNFSLKACFYQGLYYIIFWPISWFVGVAGWLFDGVFKYTVIYMANGVDGKSGINGIGGIDIAWKTMRDLANIGFIFILLWLAISTILGVGEHDVKHTLSKLIIVAILLNFSLFFTKIIIDASNILAIAFYNSIQVNGSTTNQGISGLGGALMNAFSLQTIFDSANGTNVGTTFQINDNSFYVLMGGSVVMLIATIILLASILMFIKRYVALILVMIFSPLAFAGMVLHQTEHSVHEWWNYLLKEAFFAPMYMILLWISFTIISGTAFKSAIGLTTTTTSLAGSFNSTGSGGSVNPGAASVLLNFMIVSALLISSLIVAEKMGVVGASGAMNFAKGAQGAIQKGTMFTAGAAFNNTVGKAVRTWKEKNASGNLYGRASGFDEKGNKVGFISKWTARGQLGVANSLSAGFEHKLESEAKYRKLAEDEFHNDPKRRARMALDAMGKDESGKHSAAMQGFEQDFHHLSTKEKANLMLFMKQQLEEDNKNSKNPIANYDATGDWRYKRLFTDHGHGRNTDQETREIFRYATGGNEFYDDQFRSTFETDKDSGKIKNPKAAAEWISSPERTHSQILSGFQSLGPKAAKLIEDPDIKKEIGKAIFNIKGGEKIYTALSNDDLVPNTVKVMAGNAAYDKGELRDIVDVMKDNVDARANKDLVIRLQKLLDRVSVKPENEAAFRKQITGTIEDRLAAYDKFVRADHAPIANLVKQTNGSRTFREEDSHLNERRETLDKLDKIVFNTAEKAAKTSVPPKENKTPKNPISATYK